MGLEVQGSLREARLGGGARCLLVSRARLVRSCRAVRIRPRSRSQMQNPQLSQPAGAQRMGLAYPQSPPPQKPCCPVRMCCRLLPGCGIAGRTRAGPLREQTSHNTSQEAPAYDGESRWARGRFQVAAFHTCLFHTPCLKLYSWGPARVQTSVLSALCSGFFTKWKHPN